MDNLLECKKLTKFYNDGEERLNLVNNLDFSLKKGEVVAITGRSGSGKTTILNLLAGIDSPSSGDIILDKVNIANLSESKLDKIRNKKIGIVFQENYLLKEFTALENVCIPLQIKGVGSKEAAQIASNYLSMVGLASRADHFPAELSGGEQQRVAVARAFVSKPKFILADEPTGSLDSKTADEVFDMMLRLTKEQGASLVVVTHDLKQAEKADRVMYLDGGVLLQKK